MSSARAGRGKQAKSNAFSAESCTGSALSVLLSETPGASDTSMAVRGLH